MSAIIYSAEFDGCSVTIPIVTVVQDKYALIGPEYKKGVVNCIKYEDFQPPVAEHKPGKYSCNDRCLDLYVALKDNFQYFGELTDAHLLGCLAIYVWIAKKTGIQHLIPDVLLGLIEVVADFGDIPIFVAKYLDDPAPSVTKIREWYFVQLGMQANTKDLLIDADVGKILVAEYVPGIIRYTVIKDQDQFDKMLVALVNSIESNTKFLNFIHGSMHIGHVSVEGKLIDFGKSFNIFDKESMKEYLTKHAPSKKKAIEKYNVQQIDVGCACTLIELKLFLQSIVDGVQKCPSLVRFKPKTQEMIAWISEILQEYFDDFELSIFTMIKQKDYAVLFGGFDAPPDPAPINEKFPTQFFLEEFGLSQKMAPDG